MEVAMSDGKEDKGLGEEGGDKCGGHGDDHAVEIKIDRAQFKVTDKALTGAQLRRLPEPDVGPDRDLFEVVPGGSDRKIELTEVVKMRDGLRFFTAPAQINPGRT
jgi:hypothetical protein